MHKTSSEFLVQKKSVTLCKYLNRYASNDKWDMHDLLDKEKATHPLTLFYHANLAYPIDHLLA